MQNNDIAIAPVASHLEGAPKINGPALYGASPGKDFLYAIPCRGERPICFSLSGKLPNGLSLDSETGFITGSAKEVGIFPIRLIATNRLGKYEKDFKLVIEKDRLCLTPLLGWTSWNAFVSSVDQESVAKTAELLVSTGLASRGYSHINIDSCWQGSRGGKHNALQPNEKFSDMKGLVDHIHSLGLKAGIYSTPMVQAWGAINERSLPGSTGYPLDPKFFHPFFGGCGKARFEENDAKQFAEWGFDYLKYDWPECDVPHTAAMSEALRKTDRDFILSIVTGCRIEHYAEFQKYANMLRHNPDTRARFQSVRENAFSGDDWSRIVQPGTWYDMDMLALGPMNMSIPSAENPQAHLDGLSHNEAMFHMSMWAFFPSPLQISCQLDKLDDFTLSLLSNEEILDINQDELGSCAICLDRRKKNRPNGNYECNTRVYGRQLANGSEAVAFFNIGEQPETFSRHLADHPVMVRDPWAQIDIGEMTDITLAVPPHGCRIIRYKIC